MIDDYFTDFDTIGAVNFAFIEIEEALDRLENAEDYLDNLIINVNNSKFKFYTTQKTLDCLKVRKQEIDKLIVRVKKSKNGLNKIIDSLVEG